jgi:cell division protease FtsH
LGGTILDVTEETEQGPKTASRRKRVLIFVLAGLFLAYLSVGAGQREQALELGEEVPLSEVLESVESGEAQAAWLDDGRSILVLETSSDTIIHANYPPRASEEVLRTLADAGVQLEVVPAKSPSLLPSLLLTLLPVALIIGFFAFATKKGGLGSVNALGLGKSKAVPVDIPQTRFSDVAGIDEALEDLRQVVDFLHYPERYDQTGAKRPRGFLLVGPPGTGKTLLARAVAGEAGVPFYAITGADFVELFAGLGASRVRDLFNKARAQEKAIIFIDEIDAVGKARGRGPLTGANDERENTLNALLVELDGFTSRDGIVILGATNRPDVLDPALLRPGRFDRTIVVNAPDRAGRRRILDLYAANRPFAEGVDWDGLARRIQGMSGAQIEQLLNEAALEAARLGSGIIENAHIEQALATTMLGRERRSAVMSNRDREIVAWHEAGHAVAALLTENANDPVQVSIVPRGSTGGATWMTGSEHDLLSRKQAKAQLVVAMGGRAAEEILLEGDHTQGAHGDLAMATSLATDMVARFGMGRSLVHRSEDQLMMASHSRQEVDSEVNALLEEALTSASSLLQSRLDLLRAVAEELLERETIDLDDLRRLDNAHKTL